MELNKKELKKLYKNIIKSKAFDDCMTIINDDEPERKALTITRRLSKWASKIALEVGAPSKLVEEILSNKLKGLLI